MVLTVSVTHIFQVPVNQAVKLYFKNQAGFRKLDGELISSTEGTKTYNEEDGISCVKTNLTYKNFIPKFLRKIPQLEVPELVLEEESWVDLGENHYWFRYRNITWNDSLSIVRTTAFMPDEQNPKWTRFECDAGVAVEATNWARIGQGIENYMRNNMKKIIEQNIDLLKLKIEEHQKESKDLVE